MLKSTTAFLLLLTTAARGAIEETGIDPADDFSPMLFVMTMIALCVFIILIGIGIVLALVTAAFCFLLVTLGILSTSALTGIFRGKFSSGLRALHYQACAALALPAGIAIFWAISEILGSELPFPAILIIGSAAGICAGLVFAFVLDKAALILYRRFAKKPPASPEGVLFHEG